MVGRNSPAKYKERPAVKPNICCYAILIVTLTLSGCVSFPDTISNRNASNPISDIALLPYRLTKWFTDLLKPLEPKKIARIQTNPSLDDLAKHTVFDNLTLGRDGARGGKGDESAIGYWVRARRFK